MYFTLVSIALLCLVQPSVFSGDRQDYFFEVTWDYWQRATYGVPDENIDPAPVATAYPPTLLEDTILLFSNPSGYTIHSCKLLVYRQDGFLMHEYTVPDIPGYSNHLVSFKTILADSGLIDADSDILFWQFGWMKIVWGEYTVAPSLTIHALVDQDLDDIKSLKTILPSRPMSNPLYIPGAEYDKTFSAELDREVTLDTFFVITNVNSVRVSYDLVLYDEDGTGYSFDNPFKIDPGTNYILSVEDLLNRWYAENPGSFPDSFLGYAEITGLTPLGTQLSVSAFTALDYPFFQPLWHRANPVFDSTSIKTSYEVPLYFKVIEGGGTIYYNTYMTISNPNDYGVTVQFTYVSDAGVPWVTSDTLLPLSTKRYDHPSNTFFGHVTINSSSKDQSRANEILVYTHMNVYPVPVSTPLTSVIFLTDNFLNPYPTPDNPVFACLKRQDTDYKIDTELLFSNLDPSQQVEIEIAVFETISTPTPTHPPFNRSMVGLESTGRAVTTATPPPPTPVTTIVVILPSNSVTSVSVLSQATVLQDGSFHQGYLEINQNISGPQVGYQALLQYYHHPSPTPSRSSIPTVSAPILTFQDRLAYANISPDPIIKADLDGSTGGVSGLALERYGCFIKATWSPGSGAYFSIFVDPPGGGVDFYVLREKILEEVFYIFAPVEGEYQVRIDGFNERLAPIPSASATIEFTHPEYDYSVTETYAESPTSPLVFSKKFQVEMSPNIDGFHLQTVVYLSGKSMDEIYRAYGYLLAEEIVDSIFDFYLHMEGHQCIEGRSFHEYIDTYFISLTPTPGVSYLISDTSRHYLEEMATGIRDYYVTNAIATPTFAPMSCTDDDPTPVPLPTYSLGDDEFLLDLAFLNLCDEFSTRGFEHCQVADFFGEFDELRENSKIAHDVMETLPRQADNMAIMIFDFDNIPTPTPGPGVSPIPQNYINAGMDGMLYPAGVGFTENNLHFSCIMSSKPRFVHAELDDILAIPTVDTLRLNMDSYREVIEQAGNVPTAVAMCLDRPNNFNTKILHFSDPYDDSVPETDIHTLLDQLSYAGWENSEFKYWFQTDNHIANTHQDFEFGDINLYRIYCNDYTDYEAYNLWLEPSVPHERTYYQYHKYLAQNPPGSGPVPPVSCSQIYHLLQGAEPNALKNPFHYQYGGNSLDVFDITHINEPDDPGTPEDDGSDIFYIGVPVQIPSNIDTHNSAMKPHNVFRYDFRSLFEISSWCCDCINNGDVNANGTVTAGDAQMAFEIALEIITATYDEVCAADCTGDDTVTAGDAQAIFNTALALGVCSDPL